MRGGSLIALSLPHQATPAALYDELPKALPARADTHDRVRHDRIDKSGP